WRDFSMSGTCALTAGSYWLGLASGATGGLARYSHAAKAGALRYGADSYDDGPSAGFGAASSDDKEIAINATYSTRPVPGTLITTSAPWRCDQPLSSYGALPIKIVSTVPNSISANAISLSDGCSGDGDPNTVDLILDVRGDGAGQGTGGDAVKIGNPHD